MEDGNHSFLGKDELLYNFWIGDQNSQTVSKAGEDLLEIISKLKKQGKRVLILADITKLGKVTWGARQEGYKVMRFLEYDKGAIYGNYFKFKSLVEGIIMATGMGFKVKFFNSFEEAVEWLTQPG